MQYLHAFLVGGAICAIGQVLIDFTKITAARIVVTFVVIGVFLNTFGLWQPLKDFAGAGASVPIIGFGALLSGGVEKAVAQDGLLGLFTGGFTAAAAGISSVIMFALLSSLLFKSGDKGQSAVEN
ncbi:stage V sporulation protein AE [Clostridia bacterium]|nr:stage V sporulation protein AE [Clostridia bacterium]